GVPIAFSFGIATLGYLALTTTVPLTIVVNRMDEGMSNIILLAVPLFVFLGAMYLVSGISGSKAADMAAIAPALFPEMKKRGAQQGELVGLLAASGAM